MFYALSSADKHVNPAFQVVKASDLKASGRPPEMGRNRHASFVKYHLKWQAIRHLYDVIINSRLPGRPGTSMNLVGTLCRHLQSYANASEAQTLIDRVSFINALLGKYGSRMEDSKANLIFSTFDPMVGGGCFHVCVKSTYPCCDVWTILGYQPYPLCECYRRPHHIRASQ